MKRIMRSNDSHRATLEFLGQTAAKLSAPFLGEHVPGRADQALPVRLCDSLARSLGDWQFVHAGPGRIDHFIALRN
jgi:hypothetical protein